jgi:hypothetical protein
MTFECKLENFSVLLRKTCQVSVQLPHGLDHVIGNLPLGQPLGHSHTADFMTFSDRELAT